MFSLFKKNRKGDLSLSINAIVILILAITMLGLGLAFLRGTFKKTTEQFGEVSGTVKEQIIQDIKDRGEKLFIRGEPEIDIKRGETKEAFYGIKNVLTGDSAFAIETGCDNSIGGADPNANNALSLETFTSWNVKSGEVAVLPLKIVISSDATADTYPCHMTLTEGSNEYARKDFFVKIAP